MLFEVGVGAANKDGHWRLNQLDRRTVSRLDVSVLPGQWEHKLLEGFGDVELQRVLLRDQNQRLVKYQRFPAEENLFDIEQLQQQLDCDLVVVRKLVKWTFLDDERLVVELNVVAHVERGARDRFQECNLCNEFREG